MKFDFDLDVTLPHRVLDELYQMFPMTIRIQYIPEKNNIAIDVGIPMSIIMQFKEQDYHKYTKELCEDELRPMVYGINRIISSYILEYECETEDDFFNIENIEDRVYGDVTDMVSSSKSFIDTIEDIYLDAVISAATNCAIKDYVNIDVDAGDISVSKYSVCNVKVYTNLIKI